MMKVQVVKYILVSFIMVLSFSAKSDKKSVIEKEEESLNFTNIKKVLENDGLQKERVKKKIYVKKVKAEKKKIEIDRYMYPQKEDFWEMASEYWLIKNAQSLNWDVPRPQYGIATAFKGLLEKLGYYNITFKVLILNSPSVIHMALPGKQDEIIFLLSLPFMRSLDLTKVDISLLLLEDFFRIKNSYFIENLNLDTKFIGANFYEKKVDKSLLSKTLKAYNDVILRTGFTFQQQYKITKDMDQVLKSTPSIWNSYFRMLQKIDQYIKSDLLYRSYLKIYPSPELQIKWLSPKKKVI